MRRFEKGLVLILVLCLGLLVFISGCGQKETQPAEEEPKDPEFIRIGTASLGGNFFPMGAAIAVVIEQTVPGFKATAQATGGSAYNMTAIENGELEMGIAQGTAVAAAVSGTGQFEGAKVETVRTIAQYHATPQHILVRSNLKVESLSDLKGLKLEMIAPGDGVEVSSRKILEAVGISWDEIKPEYSGNRVQAASRLKTKQVDGIIDGTGIGAAWLVDVIGKGDFKLVSLSDEEIKMITDEFPEFSKVKIPAGTYVGQDRDVYTVSNWTVIVASSKLSENLVYNITKNLFENKKFLVDRHNYFSDLSPENIAGGVIAPLHPGAEKYYREIGVLK
ncbi:MAG: TAXI family TRAP transporter solute-binding subunit [Firmicutes bacterium]|nr:TAXI family TRAP transporter solute-binding subunit [Bacillota bacterium]